MNTKKLQLLTKQGFSLVELLVVVAIITIGAGVLFSRMDSTQKTKTELEVEGQKLSAILSAQRNDALSGKNAAATCKYIVNANESASFYTVSGCTQPEVRYNLPASMTFESTKEVRFTSPMGEVFDGNDNLLSAANKIDFILAKNGQRYTVSIYGTGRIEYPN